MLLKVQHRGNSHVINCRRSWSNADGVGLPLSHSRGLSLQIEYVAP